MVINLAIKIYCVYLCYYLKLLRYCFFLGMNYSPVVLKISPTCVSSVSGERLHLDCRVVGYPIPVIYWSKVRVIVYTCTMNYLSIV